MGSVKTLKGKEQEQAIKDASANLNNVAGSGEVKSLLSKARRAYKKDDIEKADTLMAEAQAVVAAEISWRKSAVTRILPGLIKLSAGDSGKYWFARSGPSAGFPSIAYFSMSFCT